MQSHRTSKIIHEPASEKRNDQHQPGWSLERQHQQTKYVYIRQDQSIKEMDFSHHHCLNENEKKYSDGISDYQLQHPIVRFERLANPIHFYGYLE